MLPIGIGHSSGNVLTVHEVEGTVLIRAHVSAAGTSAEASHPVEVCSLHEYWRLWLRYSPDVHVS